MARMQSKKVERELEAGCDFQEEYVRSQNLLAYLLWNLGQRKRALELTDKDLSDDPYNIVSLTNKAHFLRDMKDLADSKLILERLEGLNQRTDYVDLWQDSLARFGPAFHRNAAELYEKVIKMKPRGLWKFGLAFTYKRLSHYVNAQPPTSPQEAISFGTQSARLFTEIIQQGLESEKKICARSWCELAEIILFNPAIAKSLSFRMSSIADYFQEAIRLCDDDYYVLQKCGSYFRRVGDLKKSEEFLCDAIQLNDSAFARHHLALCLKQTLEISEKNARKACHPRKAYFFFNSKANVPFVVPIAKNITRHSKISNLLISSSDVGVNWKTVKRHPVTAYPNKSASTKSLKNVLRCPNNARLLEAVNHLKLAIMLEDGQFPVAHYDLGVTYQRLGQFKNAIFEFSEIQKLDIVSAVLRIRAIEQIGLTKLQMAEETVLIERKEMLFKEVKDVLWETLELQSTISETFLHIKEVSKSDFTLKKITDSVQELLHLYYATKNYKEAIALYEFISNTKELQPADHKKMIEVYMKDGEYNKAVVLWNILSSAADSRYLIDQGFFISVYIEAACDSLSRNIFITAANRFHTAYHYITNPSEHTVGDIDVVIMDGCPDEPSKVVFRCKLG